MDRMKVTCIFSNSFLIFLFSEQGGTTSMIFENCVDTRIDTFDAQTFV